MSLKPLSSVKLPDLVYFDRERTAQEIMDRMKAMPGWQDIWVNEQYQDASQFIIQTFSYLFEKIANATNKNLRENFLTEAFSERAIYANLAQMRVNALQNKAASTELYVTIENVVLTQQLILGKSLPIQTTDISGQPIIFEIIGKDESGNYLYNDSVIIQPTVFSRNAFNVMAYAGQTQTSSSSLELYDLENMRITLPFTDIIDNSIEAYYQTNTGQLIQLRKATKFVTEPYITSTTQAVFPNGVPHYIIRYDATGGATLYFGSENFGGAFEDAHIGGTIVVYCRVGGGYNTNIPAGQINYRYDLDVFGDQIYTLTFTNPRAASGGENRETPAEAQMYAPYRYGRDGTIILVDDAENALYKDLVKHEIETPQYSEIGTNIPLLHAWHYIVPKRTFTDWLPYSYTDGYTLEQYLEDFFADLNTFLKIAGTNDTNITSEYVTTFVPEDTEGNYDFVYTLVNIKPLSGTIGLTAWDYEDELVDFITWTDNYYANDVVVSHYSNDSAFVDTVAFSNLSLITDSRYSCNWGLLNI